MKNIASIVATLRIIFFRSFFFFLFSFRSTLKIISFLLSYNSIQLFHNIAKNHFFIIIHINNYFYRSTLKFTSIISCSKSFFFFPFFFFLLFFFLRTVYKKIQFSLVMCEKIILNENNERRCVLYSTIN